MSIARMTLMGMQDYLHDFENKNINDTWTLNNVQFDKDILLDTIILDAGTLGVNTTHPLQYYRQCDMWWKKWQNTFQKWWEVQEKEYEPLWNTDRYEEVHDDIVDAGTDALATHDQEIMDDDTTGSKSSTETIDDDTTNSLSVSISGTTSDSSSGTTTTSVSAYDAGNTLVTHDQVAESSSSNGSSSSTSTSSGTGTDDRTTTISESTSGTDDRTTTKDGTANRSTSNDRDFDHELHAWGNIGVMSSQDLYNQELKVRFINLYEHAAAIFIKEMTCAVW